MSYDSTLYINEDTDVHLADLGLVLEVCGHGQVNVKNEMGTVLHTLQIEPHGNLNDAVRFATVSVTEG